jgi:hypothetical protein
MELDEDSFRLRLRVRFPYPHTDERFPSHDSLSGQLARRQVIVGFFLVSLSIDHCPLSIDNFCLVPYTGTGSFLANPAERPMIDVDAVQSMVDE